MALTSEREMTTSYMYNSSKTYVSTSARLEPSTLYTTLNPINSSTNQNEVHKIEVYVMDDVYNNTREKKMFTVYMVLSHLKGLYISGDIACCWYIIDIPSSKIEVLVGGLPLKKIVTKFFHPKTT